ncbi:MAG: 7-cyano-7-deazaguanine synthase [Firmicutes bacterium]|nr:7-cyano-7-deazaguanine synthase [Bacillota bacterium]
MKKALVLSSGGIDSTTCIAVAVVEYGIEHVSTVSIFYGQKHFKELDCATKISKYYGLDHYEQDLSQSLKYSNCPLLKQSTEEILRGSYADQLAEGGIKTYVPFRNGLMLSSATTLAMSIYPGDDVSVYYGAHADDTVGKNYADCTKEFVLSMGRAIFEGTYGKVQLKAPLIDLTKAQVVELGLRLSTPYMMTWSCYEGREKPCMVCGTCISRTAAFRANLREDKYVLRD